jgi:hypothetical protein
LITPTLAEFFNHALESRLIDFHTATIGKVQHYNIDKQTVDVVPQIRRLVESDEGETVAESLPILPDVPVLFPRANSFFFSVPIKPGDFVQLIFNERSIQAWLQEGRECAPDNTETHGFHGAVALPGVYPLARALHDVHANNLVIGKDQGPQIHVSDDFVQLGKENPGDFVALASKVLSELKTMIRVFNSHTHGGPGSPAAPLMTPPSSVAATIVKAA